MPKAIVVVISGLRHSRMTALRDLHAVHAHEKSVPSDQIKTSCIGFLPPC